MASFNTKLIKKETVAKETMAFYFEKPGDFSFTPGQYIDLELLDQNTGVDDDKYHSFSIVSTPQDDFIMIATRMRGTKFKNKLKDAPERYEVGVDGSHGSFVLHKDENVPAVFLAGGIGITPFYSIIKDTIVNKPKQWMYLFYSNRRPQDIAFHDELALLAARHDQFCLIETITDRPGEFEDWYGETGRINKAMLEKNLAKLIGPIYYVAGPPVMVSGLRQMLLDAGILQATIRSEDFVGY